MLACPLPTDRPGKGGRVAWDEGYHAGSSIEGWGGACPYLHGDLTSRFAWFSGFGAGRALCPPLPRNSRPSRVPSNWVKEG